MCFPSGYGMMPRFRSGYAFAVITKAVCFESKSGNFLSYFAKKVSAILL